MKKLIFIVFLVLIFCPFTFGQNSNCPALFVTGPSSSVRPGETMSFTVSIAGNDIDLGELNYRWSVDKGTIVEGREKRTILVSTEGLIDTAITATVEIKGPADDCAKSFTEKGIVAGGGEPVTFDEFGKISKTDEKVRLSALVSELKNNTETNAFIILYHPSKNKRSYDGRVARIKNFLTKDHKIPAERVSIVFGGDDSKERTTIYLVPHGLTLPDSQNNPKN